MLRIGFDLGGTKTEVIALDPQGAEKVRFRTPTPRTYEATIENICTMLEKVKEDLKGTQELEDGFSIGLGMPGSLDQVTGLVKNANSTWLNGRNFQKDLEVALGHSIVCANDANCFALSEAVDGAGKGYKTVFGIIVGTGCGGGVVINGQVLSGCNGNAGEWGHNPLSFMTEAEYPGVDCYCGRKGCLETWISGTGLAENFEREVGLKKTTEQGLLRPLTAREVMALVDTGQEEACAYFERFCERFARALAQLINVLDPEVIVLGGGVSNIERLYPAVSALLSEKIFGNGECHTKLVKNHHGDSSGVRGAAWLGETA